jgi:Protein of unknown function (DUF4232)
MTSHVPRVPLSLAPLIAEAKRRARQRRLLLLAALAAVIAVGTVLAGTVAFRSSGRTGPAVTVAPACRTGQLHLSWHSDGVAAGTVREAFTFKNTSGDACSLRGWPSFKFVMHDGHTITPHPHDLIATAYRVSNPPPTPRLVLKPGEGAPLSVFEADGTGYQHQCALTRTVRVVPPGTHVPLSVTAALFYCGQRDMWVLPIGRRR